MARERVTVINADPEVADLFADMLSDMGFDVETYADALPGVAELIASRPALVIVNMDLQPRREQLTGLQVVHSARSSAELRDIPIIVSTTDPAGFTAAWPDLMERGDVHQIALPFDLGTFVRVVQTALGRSRGEADAGGDGGIPVEQGPVEGGE